MNNDPHESRDEELGEHDGEGRCPICGYALCKCDEGREMNRMMDGDL